ncbi:T9SS type A sorting domain-containing protein [Sporocytophaga myxococcoides]|uniref:T9SS type A sorting domain-containing protein n=1 Tax=Sporocytophaga myxococcoides TaxID=153721 RepID=UPI000429E1B0|nr:T9SS type A sorting domain-containing protein [Sporocytophaga myxococcoides]
MNKIILTILLLFFSFRVFPSSIVLNSFNGSVLCDTLSTTYKIPRELQGKYNYKVEVLKNDTTQYLTINYHLQSAKTDVLKQITVDLNKYFSPSITSSAANVDLKWTVVHNIYIEGQLKSTSLAFGWPYRPCYTSKYDCREVTIYRRRLEDICPAADVYTTPQVKIIEDSLLVNFKDVIKPRDITCNAVGTRVVIDSLVLSNLSPRDFTIFHADTQIVYCVNAPCPPLIQLTRIGNANLLNCPPLENINVFEGSFLCRNLSVNLNLPKNLQGNYSYTYKAEFVQNTLIIHYYLKQDRVEWLEKINIPVNDILPAENVIQDFNLINIPVIQNIHMDGSLYVIKGYGQPATRCFEYKTECDKITLYRRYLQPICPSWRIYSKIGYRVDEEVETIFANFNDSLNFSEVTCLAVGNFIKSDSIEITNLKQLKYELLVNEIRTYYSPLIFKAPDRYSCSSTVKLNDCVVAGTINAEVENNMPWPNPCTNEIHLKGHVGKITFTNQLGQLFVVEGGDVFNVSDLPRGLYIVTFEKDGLTRREKVILK